MVALAQLQAELDVYALGRLLHGLDELLYLALGELEALRPELYGLLVAEIGVVGEAYLGDAHLELGPGHRRHAVCRVERAAAVYMIIREKHWLLSPNNVKSIRASPAKLRRARRYRKVSANQNGQLGNQRRKPRVYQIAVRSPVSTG